MVLKYLHYTYFYLIVTIEVHTAVNIFDYNEIVMNTLLDLRNVIAQTEGRDDSVTL